MKALTLDDIGAHLILSGEQTIIRRDWKTSYRGDLLICSEPEPAQLYTIPGHALCVVKLKDIVPFKKEQMEAARVHVFPADPGYAWIIEGLTYIKPFPVDPHSGLFDVPDMEIQPIAADASAEDYGEFFRKYYLPKFLNGTAPLYEAGLCPLKDGIQWKDTDDLGSLVEGMMPLAEPDLGFYHTAEELLGRPIMNRHGVFLFKGDLDSISELLRRTGQLTPKLTEFLKAYPNCSAAFIDNFYL